ncbi:hypothetical protein [Solemya elarraichensis gill symbiont]|uniref:Uncharacterized protein n=1 Tax=Solemya elarraichensis gill symbiont TaxID=1918949 RepID=A0A1T2L624_9GAMM|nr:hypothetical protein [Solemya elarraichensis gill symbiont]OOZ40504.1 hypothetical protein BOW52_05795 [Solemya elarraichensis gill symbiont]
MKNIPLPDNREYVKQLIDKTENVIKRMRWKAFFHLHPEVTSEQGETYGFKSRKTPPQISELAKFEEELLRVIENIQFREVKSKFIHRLREDVKTIKKSKHIFVPADKTNNYYTLEKEEYNNLVKDSVTSKYKLASDSDTRKIRETEKRIAEQIHLEDRIETMAQQQAFITIKDHKDNFPNRVQCRLINPAKSEIGIISKSILDRINNSIVKRNNVRQWKNTQSVIEWFKSIPDKRSCTFFLFDVVEFYPSISEKLLKDAFGWLVVGFDGAFKLNVYLRQKYRFLFY